MADDGSATVTHVRGPQYLKTYLDIAGIPTACDGLTKGIQRGQTSTPAQCTSMLEAALVEHAAGVMRCSPGLALDKPHRDNVRAAAVSMAYNIGVGAWCGSTARKLVDAGKIRAACDAFLPWDKARVGGVLRPVKGLTARRQRERALCLKDAA
ncbi:MAG: lysozyme [Proteobacteria bacterium]|nr:lysozyme [Pseudomonadota bacterium]